MREKRGTLWHRGTGAQSTAQHREGHRATAVVSAMNVFAKIWKVVKDHRNTVEKYRRVIQLIQTEIQQRMSEQMGYLSNEIENTQLINVEEKKRNT